MEKKIYHHVLPRLYLKGFIEAPGRLFTWVYSKGGVFSPGGNKTRNNPVRTAIRSASSKPYYYSYSRRDGVLDVDTYENVLEQLEKPSNQIIEKIRNQMPITESEKTTIASYILLMHKRVLSRRRRSAQQVWTETLQGSAAVRLLSSPEFLSRLPNEKRADLESFIRDLQEEIPKSILLKTMTMEWQEATAILARMNRTFMIAKKGVRFITGDSPVFTSLGLNKLGSELSFPISTNISLVATWQPGAPASLTAPEQYVRQLNYRIASQSEQLFYYRSERWVARALNRDRHQIYLLDVSGQGRKLWGHRNFEVIGYDCDA